MAKPDIDFISGTQTSTASEVALFTVDGDRYYATWIFCHNMTSAETIVIRVYAKDINGATMRKYVEESISGVQDPPAWYLHLIPTTSYQVTIQRTAGTDKAYTWARAEI